MVSIRKRIVNRQTYYYLEHSIREGKKIFKKEKHLGKEIPKDIEKIKKQFVFEIYKEKWFLLFETIKKNYKLEQKKTPISARKKEIESFVVKFTYNTQRIEGSTLTLKETANLLERGITPKEKPISDVKEAEAHRDVFYQMIEHNKSLTFQTVLYWHKILMKQTKLDIAGKIRNHHVAIARSKFKPPMPSELDFLLKEFHDWYKKNENKLNPIELAALVHLKFVTIHPFSDGNGRISRIMMNFVLQSHGYPMMDILYVDRTSYYNALERSQVKNDNMIFLQWFFKRYAKENKIYAK